MIFLQSETSIQSKMLHKILTVLFLGAVLANALPDRRIVGGYEATEGQYPWMISLRRASMSHRCGGSIIGPHWVLTAAHCTQGQTPTTMFIVVGSILLNGGANPITHTVDRITNHEQYHGDVFAFDVATVRVRNPFVYTSLVQPIRMNPNFIGSGVSALAMGWGLTTQNRTDNGSNILLWHPTSTITNADCVSQLGSWILPQHLCSFSRLGQGICNGDSGGPLVVNNEVVGIATAVIPCARGWPDGWDRISTFHSWIVAHSSD
ncbi:hypothetical protein ACKWTF_014530 [Chironomus riparius]